ncbi:glycosyltransferase family 1 protein [Oscillatoria sp. HE19RPO]|uniref:glycosyltransferase family 4 protein n=1 Tax=Oscillatoria sp. HE19RPO TaxID=2954806 RepID=UPI0020C2DD1A|nr:glycosyltransferase family 1 protein [Oscillatoria sp. HE19RPO]
MVSVVYDYQAFSLQERGGISRYFYELATRVANYDECQVKILSFAYVNKYLSNSPKNLVVGLPIPTIPISSRAISKLNFELSKGLSQFNGKISQLWMERLSPSPDIVHETYYSSHRLAPKQSKTVITVYDMIAEKFCEFPCQQKSGDILSLKATSIQRADRVICISNNTKNDLLELVNVDPAKVSVVHLGSTLKKIEDDYNKFWSELNPYILYVGSRNSYKNFQRLLEAYARSNLPKDFQLVCFGGDPFARRELEIIKELHLGEGKVIYISGDDKKLASFYSHASAFVYPSLYEGFGIPLLEAMSCDCPVVCSNTSSMPEVAGKAAEFFDPYDPESIAYALKKVLYSTEKTEKLIQLGQERVKHYSWDTCAEQTRSIYLSLV